MCIVIDTCSISKVIDSTNNEHKKFKPVLEWLISSNQSKLVFGGTKYLVELKRFGKPYLSFLNKLKDRGKLAIIDTIKVDESEKHLNNRTDLLQCDDKHIIAIIIVSRCRLVCTGDKRSHQFLKKSDLYPSDYGIPKIYSQNNKRLLSPESIVELKSVVKKTNLNDILK